MTLIALHIIKKASFALPLLLLLVCLTLLAPVSASAEASVLDIVHITIAPDDLWDPVTGLFAEGGAIDKSELPFKNAVYRAQSDSVRKATLEYFPAGSDIAALSEDVRLTLVPGYYSLDLPQKSLHISAADGSFDYPLFDTRPFEAYHAIELSNGNGDGVFTRIATGVQTTLLEGVPGLDITLPAWKPVVVYINGEYWGHYNMRETMDAQTICRYEGLDPAQADEILIASKSRSSTGYNSYRNLLSELEASSPNTNPEDKAFLEASIDVDSFLSWFASAMYMGDSDVGEVCLYQTPDGKWQCIASPSGFGLFLAKFNASASYTKEDGMTAALHDNTAFRKILEIDEYRDLFLTKLGALYQALPTETMQAALDDCAAMIEAEMPAHFDRWAAQHVPAINHELPNEPAAALEYWRGRIARMHDGTMTMRPYYVYIQTQEAFNLTDEEMLRYFGDPCPEIPELLRTAE